MLLTIFFGWEKIRRKAKHESIQLGRVRRKQSWAAVPAIRNPRTRVLLFVRLVFAICSHRIRVSLTSIHAITNLFRH